MIRKVYCPTYSEVKDELGNPWAKERLENGEKIQIHKNKVGQFVVESTKVRTREEIESSLKYVAQVYPLNKAIADYDPINALMASFNQGIQIGLLISLGELKPLTNKEDP